MDSYELENGTFKVLSYNVSTNDITGRSGLKKYSCSIKIEFCPSPKITSQLKNFDRICFVQAVCDNILLQLLEERSKNARVVEETFNRDKNKTADFGNRLAEGWAIDQQLYKIEGENLILCNLDPRYVEQRLSGEPYRDHSDFTMRDLIGYVQNYVHGNGSLNSAILSDEPNAIYQWAGKIIPVGSQNFEVVAMLDKVDGTKEYIGSLCWGWNLEKTAFEGDVYKPELSTISIKVFDKPTTTFINAAKAWNEMLKKQKLENIEAFMLPELVV